MDDEEKVEDAPESEIEEVKQVEYVCVKKCFWNKIFNVGDSLSYKGEHLMLANFKVKEAGDPVEELIEDGEPKTLSGLQKAEAQAVLNSEHRQNFDEGNSKAILDAGQAPVIGPPAEAPVEEPPAEEEPVVVESPAGQAPVTGPPAEDESAESILE